MSAGTFELENRGPGPRFFLIFMAFMVLAGLVLFAGQLMAYDSGHALKHGETAVNSINTCIEKNGPDQVWHNPDTDRTAYVCLIDFGEYEGKFGLDIRDSLGRQWTAFIKEKLKSIEQVGRYLERGGYTRIK